MKVEARVTAWDDYTTYGYPKATARSGPIRVYGLVYVVDDDVPWNRRTKSHIDNRVGLLSVLKSNGAISKSVEIEIRPHELAKFCREFLAQYEETQ